MRGDAQQLDGYCTSHMQLPSPELLALSRADLEE